MIDVSAKIQQARQLFESGKAEQARAFLARALQQTPGHPDLSNAMSLVLQGLGQWDLAVYHAEKAAQGRPGDAGVLTNLGNALAQSGKGDAAIAAYEKALAAGPDTGGARLGLSHVLRMKHRFTEAADHLRIALRAAPNDPDLISSLAFLLFKLARVEEGVELARRGAALHPEELSCAAAVAHGLNYMPGATGQETREAHARCGSIMIRRHPVRWHDYPNSPDPERRLRVGLLSYDFVTHPISFFMEPLLRHRDRASLEVVCYFTGPLGDHMTERLRSLADGWQHLKRASHEVVAEAIHADGVDVLIELAGMAANHSMPVLSMRPAPEQVNYLGYPSTTGLPGIGYRIVDSSTDPAGYETHASETLIRLDPSFLCYQPPVDAPLPERSARGTGPVFGSFNSAPKINREVIRVWARLLRETPGSRLVLKALEFDDDGLRRDVLSRFDAAGVAADRVEILKLTRDYKDHLGVYGRVDIALDPFPYNGTTTTFEALHMGVPVVTISGDRHVARVSAMILNNLGMSELIARDEEEYIGIARGLATDEARIVRWRSELRPRLAASVLCDGAAYAGRMCNAIRGMWRGWCKQRVPV